MGRKSVDVTVPPQISARDAGKTFRLTEMSAAAAEKWALRAMLLLRNSGERVPDDVRGLTAGLW